MVDNVPSSIGYLSVVARGITAFADSNDPGNEPDAEPMLGTVTFTPQIGNKTIVAIAEEPKTFLAINQVEANLGSDGKLRPPSDGKNPPTESSGSLYLIAPDQPEALSIFGWTWTATFRPTSVQKWDSFSVVFKGAPGEEIDLVELYLNQQVANDGESSPSVRLVRHEELATVAFSGAYWDLDGRVVEPLDIDAIGLPDSPAVGDVLTWNGAVWVADKPHAGSGSGDVAGPSSSTDGHLAVFDGATGKRIKSGGAMPSIPSAPGDIGAASALHSHPISDVTGLQTILTDLDVAIGDVESVLDTILEGTL